MDLRLLCLSFWTPPIVRPQSILIGKLLPEWKNQGIEPVVLTYETCGNWDVNFPIFKIPQYSCRMGIRYIPFLNRVNEKLYFERLYNVASEIIRKYQIRLVFSFSNPQESNILGAMLKERLGIKFVSHFSDPFANHPNKSFFAKSLGRFSRKERYVVEQSDHIVFVNPFLKEFVLRKYRQAIQDKGVVIPHCYDSRLYPLRRRKNEKFLLSHIGAFKEPGRTPEPILKALCLVQKKYPDLRKVFQLKLVGGANEYSQYTKKKLEDLISEFELEGIVEIIPVVSYKESLELMVNSDCLLLIDMDMPQCPQLPSKLIDYIGSKSNILAITSPGSATDQVMNRLNGKTFAYSETTELADYLASLIDGNVDFSFDSEYANEFEVKNISYLWKQLFLKNMQNEKCLWSSEADEQQSNRFRFS
jgi:glycosyltransferase involved in cell wall biosynthesis